MMSVTTDGELINPLSTSPDDFSDHGEFSSGKRLRQQLGAAISERKKAYIDLSQRWDNLGSAEGARTAPVRGLLDAGSEKKITLDLSNYRPGDLREGARIRNEEIAEHKVWRKAFRDIEVGLLVDTLTEEIARISEHPAEMPELKLICHDQPLSTAIYPLLKSLALHAQSLPRLRKLDLNRYSRSEEVCEARLPTDKLHSSSYDKFVDRIAQLILASSSLQDLGLRMNGVHSYALATMAHALSANRTLEKLDLSRNPLCSQPDTKPSHLGIRALARTLRGDCSVTELDLSFCGIDERGAVLLANALAQNETLQRLNLGGNPILSDHPIFKDQRVVRIVGVKPAG